MHGYHVNKPIDVVSTISRVSVGVEMGQRWDETKHLAVDKYWYEDRGEWFARNQMRWLLKRVCDPSIPVFDKRTD